ncbi:MAG: hypothetical protein ABR593_10130 [Candidatus Limnocylindria bacterium]
MTQLGYYIAKAPKISAAWSLYWYRRYIYANNFDEDVNSLSPRSRGLDVFAIADPSIGKAFKVNRLNPQTMEPPPTQ